MTAFIEHITAIMKSVTALLEYFNSKSQIIVEKFPKEDFGYVVLHKILCQIYLGTIFPRKIVQQPDFL